MANSKIEWTDKVWNPCTGCAKVSAGCKNCYAEVLAKRFWKERKFTDVICHEDRLTQPLHWNKPVKIFVNSMSDLFHEKVPFAFIDSVYEVMGFSTQHIFQILTKRPERALEYYNWTNIFKAWGKWDNIWFGVSVEDNLSLKRVEILQKVPAAVRFLSVEPMLEKIELYRVFNKKDIHQYWREEMHSQIDWVIVGCESGANRRHCQIEWIENIVEQCKAANVPVFVKQININGKVVKNIEDFPVGLQIREFPKSMEITYD
ncbi:MAG: phage Gp37/Gp68 family protein [Candidatus Roizmanbacteria bacterium]|nr:phage Gp37/Gp68 family protein [Candidatus Roizmanbacteria bacterium]